MTFWPISEVAFCGLPGQRLNLVRHHRKAAAGLAGTSGFDRGIEREKVGLLGNRLDQVEHPVDALGRCSETFDFGDRLFGSLTGLFDDACGLAYLPSDFLDRGGEFLGGAGDRENIARGLLGSGSCGGRAAARI